MFDELFKELIRFPFNLISTLAGVGLGGYFAFKNSRSNINKSKVDALEKSVKQFLFVVDKEAKKVKELHKNISNASSLEINEESKLDNYQQLLRKPDWQLSELKSSFDSAESSIFEYSNLIEKKEQKLNIYARLKEIVDNLEVLRKQSDYFKTEGETIENLDIEQFFDLFEKIDLSIKSISKYSIFEKYFTEWKEQL